MSLLNVLISTILFKRLLQVQILREGSTKFIGLSTNGFVVAQKQKVCFVTVYPCLLFGKGVAPTKISFKNISNEPARYKAIKIDLAM